MVRVTVVEDAVTVAVTVTVYVPGGVPGSAAGGSLPPPPHAARLAASARNSAAACRAWTRLGLLFRNFEAAIKIAAIAKKVVTSVGKFGGASLGCCLPGTPLVDVGAVVVTLTEKHSGDGQGGFEGVTLTVDGDSAHVGASVASIGAGASSGATEQEASATLPVNPAEEFICRL